MTRSRCFALPLAVEKIEGKNRNIFFLINKSKSVFAYENFDIERGLGL